ncbi:hypothetical protein F7984_04320 [Pradoshia sp. D12]|uniref:hypothetical protein n=1 Tax=unclassified Bacillus (in: firmicutes) TaxID=185979 RepID=UPI001111BA86|nr:MULTISPECIES: hypothetical protein [unclassified Bacillus (in: firmicutes)]QFK70523.1 hypothetical protein F7984_04320 [Pradoshia sp. D12]TPF72318.1 hypothetical protein FHY44_00715 [Bacillus sp. D12]
MNIIRKYIIFIGTFLIIGIINFALTSSLDASFFDYSVFVGFFSTIIIYFFTSTGGYTSRSLDVQIQGSTGLRPEGTQSKFNPSYVFFGSLAYFLTSLIVTIFIYL